MTGEFVLALVLIALLAFAFAKSRKLKDRQSLRNADDPADPFYHPYTTAFDVVCTGGNLLAVLAENAINAQVAQKPGSLDPTERRRQFQRAHEGASASRPAASGSMKGTAVGILLDQSGSMAERMPRIAGELLAALEHFDAQGAATMLAGFSTVGWKGGRSRQQWQAAGCPAYPGRVCDLLHVVYSGFGETTTPDQLASLLELAVCFENVDGEAIAWAEGQLLGLSHERRCLIVVSDGAPVDDSTLSANGPSFLWNHLVQTISDIAERGEIALGGIGIDYRVESLYPASRVVGEDGELAVAIRSLVAELADPGCGKS